MTATVPLRILPVIVFSQFCCTSLWFAGNAVMSDLAHQLALDSSALGYLTSSVQFGFIVGTLAFAMLTIADRFSPSKVFLVSALLGALANVGILVEGSGLTSLLLFRFLTGFFLAGIYPVGMKIAADYYDKGLGKSLGYLVGALVLGTAFPHLLKSFTGSLPWTFVLISTSGLAALGGLLMVTLVPDGPHRQAAQKVDLSAFFKVFKNRSFRAAAFGYFGHMWELYAFWAFVPIILNTYMEIHPNSNLNVPLLSFLIIGVGSLACIVGGYISIRKGPRQVALVSIIASGACCLVSPFAFAWSLPIFIAFLLFWGMTVIADSPQFSTLVAMNAPAESKGTALTIVNCIGFSITIVSIQLLSSLQQEMNPIYSLLLLGIGPLLGVLSARSTPM